MNLTREVISPEQKQIERFLRESRVLKTLALGVLLIATAGAAVMPLWLIATL